eukprot:scaffold5101_cov56-Attheya_sp.AAC.2
MSSTNTTSEILAGKEDAVADLAQTDTSFIEKNGRCSKNEEKQSESKDTDGFGVHLAEEKRTKEGKLPTITPIICFEPSFTVKSITNEDEQIPKVNFFAQLRFDHHEGLVTHMEKVRDTSWFDMEWVVSSGHKGDDGIDVFPYDEGIEVFPYHGGIPFVVSSSSGDSSSDRSDSSTMSDLTEVEFYPTVDSCTGEYEIDLSRPMYRQRDEELLLDGSPFSCNNDGYILQGRRNQGGLSALLCCRRTLRMAWFWGKHAGRRDIVDTETYHWVGNHHLKSKDHRKYYPSTPCYNYQKI